MKLAVIIGWNGSVIKTFIDEAEKLGIQLGIKYPRLDPVDDAFLQYVKESDAVFIHHFSGEQIYSTLLHKLEDILSGKKLVVAIDPMLRRYATVSESVERKVSDYYNYGGSRNIRNLILYLKSMLERGSYEEPLKLPFSGIYHPDHSAVFEDSESYLGQFQWKRRVGILFYRTAWVDGDIEVVDTVIRELERREIVPVAVFTSGFGDTNLGIDSSEDCIRKFFTDNGKARVDAVINLMSFSLLKNKGTGLLESIGIPVFQGLIYYYKTHDEWLQGEGMDVVSTIMSVMLPEMDGTIEPIITGVIEKVSYKGFKFRKLRAVTDQISYLISRVNRWVDLKYKPNSEKKVAIILHSGSSYKDLEANIGTATGLDTLQSSVNILKSMIDRGYSLGSIPDSGEDLIKEIMERRAVPEGRWTTINDIESKGGRVGDVTIDEYNEWLSEIPEKERKEIIERWLPPVSGQSAYMFNGREFLIPGFISGNVMVAIQPKRIEWKDDENSIRLIHDSHTPLTPYWIAFYKWMERKFMADVIIHVGTHGTLEFTPGKGLALSSGCSPQVSIGTVPHLYIYSTNVPGEGITAKRRSYAVLLDHITPPTSFDDMPEEARELEDLIEEYEESEKAENPQRREIILGEIKEKSSSMGLTIDFSNPEKGTHEIEHRLNLFKDSVISKGLHSFGDLPGAEDLAEYVLTASRFEESSLVMKEGKDKAQVRIIEAINEQKPLPPLEEGILKNIIASRDSEMNGLLSAMDGKFIPVGPSGSLTRGRYDVIPTGRNFYAVDPFKVPTTSAWQIGVLLANRLIRDHLDQEGKYPSAIGFVLWSTDVFRSDGELVSQVLYTLGVEPIWQEGSRKIKGVRPIPLADLGRPRIDVVIQISGIVRDNLFNLVELIDEAVTMVSRLDEPDDSNFVVKNAKKYGHTNRIFSSRPGSYGSGVSNAVESGEWLSEGDLADVFLNWMGYAYGKGKFGIEAKTSLMEVSRDIDTLVHKREIDEIDIMDDSCNYSYAGGFYLLSKKSGSNPRLMFEDTFNPGNPKIRTMKDEIERTSVGKLLNGSWIDSQKNFGYRGATEMLKKIEHLYGWASTTRMVNDRIFDRVTEQFVINGDMREWFKKENPWAFEELTGRLIEAANRGIWKPAEGLLENLNEIYSGAESEAEN